MYYLIALIAFRWFSFFLCLVIFGLSSHSVKKYVAYFYVGCYILTVISYCIICSQTNLSQFTCDEGLNIWRFPLPDSHFSLNQEIMGRALQSLLCYWRTELLAYPNYDIADEQDAEVVKNRKARQNNASNKLIQLKNTHIIASYANEGLILICRDVGDLLFPIIITKPFFNMSYYDKIFCTV